MHRDRTNDLTFYFGRIDHPQRWDSYRQLLKRVLDVEHAVPRSEDDPWRSFSFFSDEGACVANIDAAILPIVLAGVETATIGLRSVAVDEAWRGQGLFHALMTRCLAWCDARRLGLTLLFTEDPDLYERYGFQRIPQHAFVGPCPAHAANAETVRRLDPHAPGDRDLIRSRLVRRAPLSSQCALGIDPDQTLMNLTKEDAYPVALVGETDTLVVFGYEDEALVIADIISPGPPDLSVVVGAIGRSSQRLKVLFPPDRLDWSGLAVAEDTGLMIRGSLPSALQRPFMIPPTAEF